MPTARNRLSQRDSNQIASGVTGAVHKRKIARSEALRLRALAKNDARLKAKVTRELVAKAVSRARIILTDDTFVDILRSQGIQTLPRSLATNARPTHDAESIPELSKEHIGDDALDFVIAWTFLFPLLAIPAIAAHLDEMWPGFVWELKDAFISLVAEGLFPQ